MGDYAEHIALSQKTPGGNSGKRVVQTSPVPAGFFHPFRSLPALTMEWRQRRSRAVSRDFRHRVRRGARTFGFRGLPQARGMPLG